MTRAPGARCRAIGPAMLFALTLGGTLFSLVVGGLAVTRILQLPYGDRQIVVGSFAAVTIARSMAGRLLASKAVNT